MGSGSPRSTLYATKQSVIGNVDVSSGLKDPRSKDR